MAEVPSHDPVPVEQLLLGLKNVLGKICESVFQIFLTTMYIIRCFFVVVAFLCFYPNYESSVNYICIYSCSMYAL